MVYKNLVKRSNPKNVREKSTKSAHPLLRTSAKFEIALLLGGCPRRLRRRLPQGLRRERHHRLHDLRRSGRRRQGLLPGRLRRPHHVRQPAVRCCVLGLRLRPARVPRRLHPDLILCLLVEPEHEVDTHTEIIENKDIQEPKKLLFLIM